MFIICLIYVCIYDLLKKPPYQKTDMQHFAYAMLTRNLTRPYARTVKRIVFSLNFDGLLTRPYAKPYAALRTHCETHTFAMLSLRGLTRNLTQPYARTVKRIVCSLNFNGFLTRPYAKPYAALHKWDENHCFLVKQ